MSRQTDWPSVARNAAQKYGLLPDVFARQIKMESGFNPKAISPAGARGIAQIMPETAKSWGVNPDDPQAALEASAKNQAGYLKTYLGGRDPRQVTNPTELQTAYDKMLRAYNAGPGAVEASRKYAETNAYVKNILGPIDFTKQLQGGVQVPQQQQQPSATTPTSNEFLATYLGQQNKLLEALVESKKKESTQEDDGFGGLSSLFKERKSQIDPQSLANSLLTSSQSYV